MKRLYLLLALTLLISFNNVKATNVVIVESVGYSMATNWQVGCQALGYNSTIVPYTELNTDDWFDTTDVLIISNALIALTPAQIDTIQAFVVQGGRVYLQAEYLNTYSPNVAFEQIVNATGGSFTWNSNTTAGQLVPMFVVGSLGNTPNYVDSLPYYWYGDNGTWGVNSHIEPFMQYGCLYFGFIYCCPTGGRVITQSDQDWVNQNYSPQLVENILINLASPTYACQSNAGSTNEVNVYLGPDTTICSSSSLTLNGYVQGATNYLWSNNATTTAIAVNTAGTYWVSVTTACGTGADTINVTTLHGLTVNLGHDTAVCNNSPVILNGTTQGATGYLWSNNATTPAITVTTAGTYWLAVSGGCTVVTDTIHVTASAAPVVDLGSDTSFCASQPITLNGTVQGATAYLWSNNATSPTITVSATGTYWVSVNSACGVTLDTIRATAIPAPVINLGNDTTVCTNQPVTLNGAAQIAATYLWSTSATTAAITVHTTGNYWVSVSTGCGIAGDTVAVTVLPSPVINLGNDTTICSNRSITLNGTTAGATSYSWSTNANTPTITASTAGTYWVAVRTVCGTASDTIRVSTIAYPVVTLGNDTTICANLPVTLNGTVQSATGYLWSNSATTPTITVHATGTYWVVSNNSCGTATDTVQVTAKSSPVITLTGDTGACNGQSVELNAGNAGSTFAWSNGAHTQIDTVAAGNYTVTVTNLFTCSATAHVQVSANLLTDSTAVHPTTCGLNNGSVQVFTSDSHTPIGFNWSNSATASSLSNLSAATYTVTLSDALGCTATASAAINQSIAPVITISCPDSIICNGDTASICALPGFSSYSWNDGQTSQCIGAQAMGNYYVTAQDTNHCAATSNHIGVVVIIPVQPVIVRTGDTLTCTTAGTYQWLLNNAALTGDTTNQIVATQNGNYQVIVTQFNVSENHSCAATSSEVSVNILGINNINAGNYIKIYPNPLSGGNWHLDVTENLLGSLCEIFDADGRMVYKSEIMNLHNNLELNVAQGVYILEIHTAEGNYNFKLVKLN